MEYDFLAIEIWGSKISAVQGFRKGNLVPDTRQFEEGLGLQDFGDCRHVVARFFRLMISTVGITPSLKDSPKVHSDASRTGDVRPLNAPTVGAGAKQAGLRVDMGDYGIQQSDIPRFYADHQVFDKAVAQRHRNIHE